LLRPLCREPTIVPSIILTGFMGTGKTAVGREIARRLGRTFVDTDALIVESAGQSITDIFAQAGEPRFRELERAAIAHACTLVDAVVATGGGAMLDRENRERMKKAGIVVCLQATEDVIMERVGGDATRPLLQGGDARDRLRTLAAQRADAYAAADHHVDTSGRSVAEVAETVVALLPAAGGG
jgi:shikimate kinase